MASSDIEVASLVRFFSVRCLSACASPPGAFFAAAGLPDGHAGAMTAPASYRRPPAPDFLFDLDETPIDSVHQHVAWRAALSRLDIDLSVADPPPDRDERRDACLRPAAETGRTLSEADIARLHRAHGEEYLARPTPSGWPGDPTVGAGRAGSGWAWPG